MFAALTVLIERVAQAQRCSGMHRLVADRHLVNVALVEKRGEGCPFDLLGSLRCEFLHADPGTVGRGRRSTTLRTCGRAAAHATPHRRRKVPAAGQPDITVKPVTATHRRQRGVAQRLDHGLTRKHAAARQGVHVVNAR